MTCEHEFKHENNIIYCTKCHKRWMPEPILHFERCNYREGTKTGYVNGEWVTVPGGVEIDYGDILD